MIYAKKVMVVSPSFATHKKHNQQEGEVVLFNSSTNCTDNQNKKASPRIQDVKLSSINGSPGFYRPCPIQDELKQMEWHSLDVVEGRDVLLMEGTRVHPDNGQIVRESMLREGTIAHWHHNQSDLWKSQDDEALTTKAISLLKGCAKNEDLQGVTKLHSDLAARGLLENNVVIGSSLVSLYAKFGALEKAQEVFDCLKVRNVVLWTALITGYAQQGHGKIALKYYDQMQLEGFSPNAMTFSSVLKACASLGMVEKGEEIHVQSLRKDLLKKDVVVTSALIDMYAKCGALEKAQGVFDELLVRNKVTWNVLITGYAKHGCAEEALKCFECMQLAGFRPNAVTLASMLKACGSLGDLEKGEELHTLIVREHLLEKDVVIGTALVDMYAKCGALDKAQEVFNQIPLQDTVLWNALITGYVNHGHGKEALYCFEQMQLRGCSPNAATFTCVLNACSSLGDLEQGRWLHSQIVKENILEGEIQVANKLIDMYVKSGALRRAQEVFQGLATRDNVTWNALIAGYAQHGHGEEALRCYEQMQLGGLSPDAITFACILKSCGSIGAVDKGQEIHAQIAARSLLERDIMVGTALVDMYAKCGVFHKAWEVFDKLPAWSVVLWNALIAGYTQHELDEEALCCFEQMQHYAFVPDEVTYTSMLKASGSIGTAYMGQHTHAEIVRCGLADRESTAGVALVAMYANCGMLAEAHYMFDKLPVRDAVSWSMILSGYAHLGNDEMVFNLLDRMIREGIEPNSAILSGVLNVCSHRGLPYKGQLYFERISERYGIDVDIEHYTCMVDLFGRAGQLHEAAALTELVSLHNDITIWHTLLSACRKWGDMKLGRWAFDCAVQLGEADAESDAAVYISLSNIFAGPARLAVSSPSGSHLTFRV